VVSCGQISPLKADREENGQIFLKSFFYIYIEREREREFEFIMKASLALNLFILIKYTFPGKVTSGSKAFHPS